MKNTQDLKEKCDKELKKTAQKLLKNIQSDYSTTFISPPKTGKTSNIKYILRNPEKITPTKKEYFSNIAIIPITLNAHIQDNKKQIVEGFNSVLNKTKLPNDVTWNTLEEKLQVLLDNYLKIVFLIDNAELLYQDATETTAHLTTLIRTYPSNTPLIFLTAEEPPSKKDIKKAIGDLTPFFTSNLIYNPLLTPKQSTNLIKLRATEANIKLNTSEINKIIKLSGNHIGVIRIILRFYAKTNQIPTTQEILKNIEILDLYLRTWNSFNIETQEHIDKDPNFTNDYIHKCQLKKNNKTWFNKTFNIFIKNRNKYLDNQEIQTPEKILTWQELTVFNLLKDNKGKPVNREQIAKEIWKDEWLDKYSEWMIEKIISNIRKKLGHRQDISIKTIRKKGYSLLYVN